MSISPGVAPKTASSASRLATVVVSSSETPKNLLIRARRGNPLAARRAEEYETFKGYYHIDPSLDHFLQELEAGRRHS